MYKDLKTFKELKYNYITFNIKDIEKAMSYTKEYPEKKLSDYDLDLEKFVIRIPISKISLAFGQITLYVFINKNIIEIYSYDSEKYEFKLDIVYDIFKIKNNNIDKGVIYCSSKILSLASKHYIMVVARCLTYIMEKICNRKVIYKQIKSCRKSNEKNNNSRAAIKKNIEVISEEKIVYFTIDNITNDEIKLLKRSYNRKIESWYVLPHTRRYKNGKVVQVKGYYKGDKDKAKAKTYVL